MKEGARFKRPAGSVAFGTRTAQCNSRIRTHAAECEAMYEDANPALPSNATQRLLL